MNRSIELNEKEVDIVLYSLALSDFLTVQQNDLLKRLEKWRRGFDKVPKNVKRGRVFSGDNKPGYLKWSWGWLDLKKVPKNKIKTRDQTSRYMFLYTVIVDGRPDSIQRSKSEVIELANSFVDDSKLREGIIDWVGKCEKFIALNNYKLSLD